MNIEFRPSVLLLTLPLILTFTTPLHAAAPADQLPDAQALMQLEQRAEQAKPREQCFLYTELVHTMTEIAGKQMLDGDIDNASATLKKVAFYAQLIHLNLANDTKRLKNAEMLMHRTTHRLGEYLHLASGDDRVTLQATLKQLDQVQDELLTQVFKH
ncbi:MAG TPA: hypothetical protein VK627_03895 [Edaphobacter sp.]|nr:hypothetical protein [Edaphobacter sp.]